MSKKHQYFERDHSTGQLWKVEWGQFGTKIRTLVRGPSKHEAAEHLLKVIEKISNDKLNFPSFTPTHVVIEPGQPIKFIELPNV